MKKHKRLFTAAMILASAAFISTAYAQTRTVNLQINDPDMTINGEVSKLDSPPVIENGRTLVPVRAVVEALEGNVDWDSTTKTATLTNSKGDEVKLTINSNTAYYNGKAEELDAAPVIINERTMLPIRFVAESFGYTTDWNAADKSIVISYGEDEETEPDVELNAFDIYTDINGNSYIREEDNNINFMQIKDKNGKKTARYKEITANEEVYKNKKGDTLIYGYNADENKTTVTINDVDKKIAFTDNYEYLDADGNRYEFCTPDIKIFDKKGNVIDEYTSTNELRYPMSDENGNVGYYVIMRNGGYEEGFIYPDGNYVPFEDKYDLSYMGDDGRIYNIKYNYIIVTDDSYKKIEEWKEIPDSFDNVYASSDNTEYVLTGDFDIAYLFKNADEEITLTCDHEEEHNKKLFASGSYGTDDTIYYDGSDGNTYVAKDNVFTVYNAEGKKTGTIKLIRDDSKYKSSNGKTYTYSYLYDDNTCFIKTESGIIKLNEIMG